MRLLWTASFPHLHHRIRLVLNQIRLDRRPADLRRNVLLQRRSLPKEFVGRPFLKRKRPSSHFLFFMKPLPWPHPDAFLLRLDCRRKLFREPLDAVLPWMLFYRFFIKLKLQMPLTMQRPFDMDYLTSSTTCGPNNVIAPRNFTYEFVKITFYYADCPAL